MGLLDAESASGNTAPYKTFKSLMSRLVSKGKITPKEKHEAMSNFRKS